VLPGDSARVGVEIYKQVALEEKSRFAIREGTGTYLPYPQWSTVHAYEDLASFTRKGSESDLA
jgi:hypothetical protein